MARQSDKPQTIKTTNPQSSRLAGFTDTTLEDASAWNTADGVKQDRGWAYADGSTLVNTSGKYNSYLARTGSLVLPNGPFRTKEVDNSVLSIGLTGTTKTLTAKIALAVAYTDSENNWRLKFNISGVLSGGEPSFEIDITGVAFKNTVNFSQAVASGSGNAGAFSRALTIPGANSISFNQSIATSFFRVSGDVALESKPTWADANLESYPVVQLYDSIASGALGLPEATADVSGIVSTGAQNFAGNKTFNGSVTTGALLSNLAGGGTFQPQNGSVTINTGSSSNIIDMTNTGPSCFLISINATTSGQTDVSKGIVFAYNNGVNGTGNDLIILSETGGFWSVTGTDAVRWNNTSGVNLDFAYSIVRLY